MGLLFTSCLLFYCFVSVGREYHVSKKGSDQNVGTKEHPFKTISRASIAAKPADIIIVHAGIYREKVRPSIGGTASSRIIYRSAMAEKVEI